MFRRRNMGSVDKQSEFEQSETIFVSHPKTGRTWLRVMITHYVSKQQSLDESQMLNLYKLTSSAGLPLATFDHDRGNVRGGLSTLDPTKERYRDKRVILLTRNVKDTIVSTYFQLTKRKDTEYGGTLKEFIRDPEFGTRKILTFYKQWYEARDVPTELLLMKYEDIHRDPEEALRTTLEFLRVRDLDEGLLKESAEYGDFSNMRELERRQFYKGGILKPGDEADEESYKTRKGVAGGYTEYMDEADVRFVDELYAELGSPYMDNG